MKIARFRLGIACGGGHWVAVTAAIVLVELILILGRHVDDVLKRRAMDHRQRPQVEGT